MNSSDYKIISIVRLSEGPDMMYSIATLWRFHRYYSILYSHDLYSQIWSVCHPFAKSRITNWSVIALPISTILTYCFLAFRTSAIICIHWTITLTKVERLVWVRWFSDYFTGAAIGIDRGCYVNFCQNRKTLCNKKEYDNNYYSRFNFLSKVPKTRHMWRAVSTKTGL